jgi:hypothetical protein
MSMAIELYSFLKAFTNYQCLGIELDGIRLTGISTVQCISITTSHISDGFQLFKFPLL